MGRRTPGRRLVAMVRVLDQGSGAGPEHDVPQGHEDRRVQRHLVHHQSLHDEHLQVGEDDGGEAPHDQLRHQHHGVEHVGHLHARGDHGRVPLGAHVQA